VRIGEQSLGYPPSVRVGQIEYRLARDAVVREFRRGRLSRPDICDAQVELLRVARHHGARTELSCPICETAELVHVSYAFGNRLPPSGRAITSAAELSHLSSRQDHVACYVIEVCPECSWNHLVRMFVVGGRRAAPRR
jgi:hypothetical protein